MSVASPTNKVQYVLASLAPTLAVPFYFIEDAHVKVIRTRAGFDDEYLTKDTHFTVSGAGNMVGGSITLLGVNVAVADVITVKRVVPFTQLFSYVPNDRFPAATQERALDFLTMLTQQVREITERSLVFAEGEVVGSGNILPEAADRALKVLGFDANGLLDLTVSLDDIRRLILVNPVDALTSVTDYGTLGEATDFADYGTI